jgi:acyl-CoA dehydrogenase
MSEVDPLITETADRVLSETCPPEAVELAEATGWCPSAWEGLSDAGFTHIGLAEEKGGSGGSIADAAAIVRTVGRHAAPIPIAETALLGGWLLAEAGIELPEGPVTVAPGALKVEDGRIVGTTRVAWAARSTAIAVLVEWAGRLYVSRVDPDEVKISVGTNLAGEPRETVRFDLPFDGTTHAPAPAGVDADALRIRGALSRVLLMAGATEAMTRMTLDYTQNRRQFGRPVAQFQAVQLHLVEVAQCAAQLSTAADLAVRAFGRGNGLLEVAAAKVVAEDVAEAGTRAAHQAHGAMGVTREYPLHLFTRRLWAWRREYGTAREWSRNVGQLAVDAGPDGLFPLVADG